jgi:uncharacterized protein YkwD
MARRNPLAPVGLLVGVAFAFGLLAAWLAEPTLVVLADAGSTASDVSFIDDVVPTDAEMNLLALTNRDRANNGLAPVAFDQSLLAVARMRAAAQNLEGPMVHYNSAGQVAIVRLLAEAGVDYTMAGENLARGPSADPVVVRFVNDALMSSPSHRRNILEPTFNRLAVGEASLSSEAVAFAQVFRRAPDDAISDE